MRGGLLNLYRYDHEIFRYEDGHLLLRGNNGTGKSRVLALQLPFLFDGEVASHRVEPDRDPAKRIEWNLLLGKYPDRLGYTWLELGRLDEDGEARYLTLGCGLQAVAGRGLTGRWFFLTDQRVELDLFLVTESGHTLSRPRLVEAIGDRGEVFVTAARYRDAIDRRLFHLGRERYGALIDLLIQLRQPQLSRKLDEAKLSAALSEALAPLDPRLLDDVAEAFRGLDDDRETVAGLEAAQGAVAEFLRSYGRYTQIAARRRAEGVRLTHSAYETTMRRLRAAESELDDRERRLTAVSARLAELEVAEEEASATVRTLESSPEMRDKQALDAARRLARERRADADRAGADAEAAEGRSAAREDEDRLAGEAAGDAWRAAEASLGAARRAAAEAGLERTHEQAILALELPEHTSGAAEESRRRLAEEASRRRRGAEHLRGLERALEAREMELTRAKERHAEASVELDESLESQRRARAGLATSVASLADAYREWQGSLTELRPADPEDVAAALDAWAGSGEGESPVEAAARDAGQSSARRLAAGRAEIEGRIGEIEAALEDLRAEEERVRAGVHRPPPVSYTRSEAGRESRPGAPFWSLCDFAPEVAESERAGVEAALEAAGLLDAWVTPEGRVLEAGDLDAVLVATDSASPSLSREDSLARVLRPAVERRDGAAAVGDATIAALLSRIGLRGAGVPSAPGDGEAWVAADGRFRLGPLHGSWSKPAAQHVGAAAREAERRRRLAALAEEITAAEGSLREEQRALDEHRARERRARQELLSAPSSDGVRRALAELEASTSAVHRARERVARAEEKVVERRRAAEAARDERDAAARDLGLGDWVGRLAELLSAIARYEQSLAGLWPTLGAHGAARRQARDAARRAEEARRELDARRLHHRRAEQRARQAAVESETLQSSLGAGVEEILARLEEARAREREARSEHRETLEERQKLVIEQTRAQKDIEREQENLERDTTARDRAIASLGRYVAARLLSVALPSLDAGDPGEWAVSRAVEVARRIDADLAAVTYDDAAWERNNRDILRHFQILTEHLLQYGYQPVSSMEDDLFVVMVPFQGRDCTVAELAASLVAELAERQRILNAREREVIENHLIGEVATHLHERLRAGEEWVREMNDELRERPMSTGMALRFSWQPIPDHLAGLADARRRLLGAGGTWSTEDREALGKFLHKVIQDEREHGEGTWRDQLANALDYRAWHRFGVERRQDGQWKPLTRRTHGTGSGGEKAIALTIPQFAAAAAHYRTAHPQAPRLILLDEAFVGVDADMRAKCMGLLNAFDLDFVMTSEREWGCYATLPGVAIYHLSSRPGIDAVGVTRWVWNGRERVLAP